MLQILHKHRGTCRMMTQPAAILLPLALGVLVFEASLLKDIIVGYGCTVNKAAESL